MATDLRTMFQKQGSAPDIFAIAIMMRKMNQSVSCARQVNAKGFIQQDQNLSRYQYDKFMPDQATSAAFVRAPSSCFISWQSTCTDQPRM